MAKINTTFSFQDQITESLIKLVQTLSDVTNTIQTMDSEMKNANAAISSVTEASKAMENGIKSGVNPAVEEMADKATKSESGISKLASKLFTFNQLTQTVSTIKNIGNAFTGVMNDMAAAYDIQAQAELKTETVMRNHMHATDEQIQQIKDLASQQQSVGIYGDEMQLEGIQELATYVDDVETLKSLVPVLNSFTAQKFGMGASTMSMVQSATALGKVMQGQTGGLSKQGYKFSEAEEKILESGTEAERVKVLTDAIIGNFGDMNQALAGGATGKIKQVENDLGDLKEVTGGLLKPLQQEIMATTMVLSRDFYATLNGIVKIVAPILQRGVEAFRNFYEKASGGFEEVSRKIEAGCQLILNNIEPLAQGIIISVGVVSAALIELGVHFAIVKAQAWAAGHASVIAAIKSAVAWAVAHWEISLIIGVVIGLIALLLRFAGVANVIGAIFGGAFGFIKTVIIDCFAVAWNTIVPIINLMLGIGETIYNAITNPIGALKNFFYTAFDFIGDILQSVFASIPGIGKKLAKDFAANRKHIMEARQEDLEKTGEWRQFKRVNQMGASELISGTIEGAKTGMKVANKLEDVIKGVKLGGDNNNLQDAISAALDDKFSTDGSGSLETKDKTLLDISSDYRELLTQAATRRFNLKFQQVTPNVTISGVQFGANADLDTVIEKFTDKIEEVSNSALAG